jgi:hypothetical protein
MVRAPGLRSDPVLTEIGGDGIEPREEAIVASQSSQIFISLDKHLLRHILRIMEVSEPGIHKRVNAGFVFVHEEAECC